MTICGGGEAGWEMVVEVGVAVGVGLSCFSAGMGVDGVEEVGDVDEVEMLDEIVVVMVDAADALSIRPSVVQISGTQQTSAKNYYNLIIHLKLI